MRYLVAAIICLFSFNMCGQRELNESSPLDNEIVYSIQSDNKCMGGISSISKVKHLGDHFKAIEYDLGLSTDLQPRKGLYIVFDKNFEYSNTYACFYIGALFYSIDNYNRISEGIYEFDAVITWDSHYPDLPKGIYYDVKIIINTSETIIKDDLFVKDVDDFADGPIDSKMEITFFISEDD